MSADKYPSIFSRQMEVIVYIIKIKKIEYFKRRPPANHLVWVFRNCRARSKIHFKSKIL